MEEVDDTAGTAAYLKTTPGGLLNLRLRGQAPPAMKVGRKLLWRRVDVDAWLMEHREDERQGVRAG